MVADDWFFEVATPLGFNVRITRRYWDLIVSVKHPVMRGREITCETRSRCQIRFGAVAEIPGSIYSIDRNGPGVGPVPW